MDESFRPKDLQETRHELDAQPQRGVIKALKRGRFMLKDGRDKFAKLIDIFHEKNEQSGVFRTWHQLKSRFRHHAERSLRTDDRFRQIKDTRLTIPDIPKVIAGRVFTDFRLCRFDLVVIFFYQFEQIAIHRTFKIILSHLFVELSAIERLDDTFDTIRENKL